jgi:hypothetical protein
MYHKGKTDDSDKFDRNFRRQAKKKNARPQKNNENEDDYKLQGPIDASEVFKSFDYEEHTEIVNDLYS